MPTYLRTGHRTVHIVHFITYSPVNRDTSAMPFFCAYDPDSTRHEHLHWGHFRSPDLIHWELLPPALAPTPGGHDADGCFSGNAVSDGERLVAFYSANRADLWWQPIATAESRDGGLTWT